MAIAAPIASGSGLAESVPGSDPDSSTKNRDDAALGARLQGVQHFGLAVQNMDRAFAFYTEVLGGSEMTREGDFRVRSSPTAAL
jgi:hypothetical protein